MKLPDKLLVFIAAVFSLYANGEKLYNDIQGYHELSEAAQSAFRDFDDKVGACLDETKNGNPYPVSEWLIVLPQEKQHSVLMYLSSVAMFHCSEEARKKLERVIKEQGETHFLAMMKEEGWLSPLPYSEFADSEGEEWTRIQLSDKDKAALQILIERNYLPFDVIQTKIMLDILRDERGKK